MTDDFALAPAGPALAGLALIARHLGRAVPAETFARGLPRGPEGIDWDLVPEAAAQGGLTVGALPLAAVTRLPGTLLPALVRRADGGAWALLAREGERFQAADPDDAQAAARWLRAADVDHLRDPEAPVWCVQEVLRFDEAGAAEEDVPGHDWLWGPLRANGRIYATAVLAGLVIQLLSVVSTFYVMAVYDRVIPNRALDTLAVLTTGVVIVYGLDLVLKGLRSHLVDAAGRRLDYLVGRRLFAAVLRLPALTRPGTGGGLAATVKEFETLREFFTAATLTVLGDLPFLFIFIALVAWLAGPVAWAPLVGVPLVLGGMVAFLWPMGRLAKQSQRESGQRQALLHEAINGLDTLQAVGGESWARRRWDRMLQANAETQQRSRWYGQMALHGAATLQSLVTVATTVAAALLVTQGKLSTGGMVAVGILVGRALQPLALLTGLIARIQGVQAAYQAIDKVFAAAAAEAPAHQVHLPRIRGAVTLRGLTFAYPGQPGAAATEVLRGVDGLVIAGEHVAVLGRVGSGKSTLLNLITGQLAPTAGFVAIDGVDVRQIAAADRHAQIGVVPQVPFLFGGTIRENVTLGYPGATDAEVLEAARVAGLDEILAGLPEGLGFHVGEGGRRLSGGMRQAVAIARALITDPPVLVLDEPTSMLDQAGEKAFLDRLALARRGKTTIIVTHRPAVLAVVQRVMVLEAGRVAADGPRDQVLASLRGS